MDYIDRLSIILTYHEMENILNSGSKNTYSINQVKAAKERYLSDLQVIQKMASSRKGEEFKSLFDNGDAVSCHLRKYHTIKYAIGSLAMKILYFTKGDISQTDRILHRSPTFKFWTDPKNAPSNDTRKCYGLDWDKPYLQTAGKYQTHGEIELNNLLIKMNVA